MNRARVARTLLRLYPRRWRERYGEEYAAVLEQHGIDAATLLDVAAGALDARLGGGVSTLDGRRRGALVVGLWAFAAYVAAGAGFAKVVEYDDFAHAAHAHLAVGAGFDLVRAGAVIAGLAVLAAAAIVLTAAVRDLRAGHTELVRPLVTGVLALLALVALPALLAVAARLTPAGGPHRPENLLLIGGWLLAAAIAATVGLASAGAVVRRVALRPERLRRAMLCAWICAGGIATSLAGMVLWGVGLKVAAPLVFDLPGGGIVSTPTAPSWVAQTVVMAGALVAALIALARSLRGDDPAPAGE